MSKPSLEPEEGSNLSELSFAGLLLPTKEYITKFTVFPGGNCNPDWGLDGDFYMTSAVYAEGKKVGSLNSACYHKDGCIEVDVDELVALHEENLQGLILTRYSHPENIPVELYTAHVHRASGGYVSYPALTFSPESIYPELSTQLENKLFWPSVPMSEGTEAQVVVLNPYDIPYRYQLSLYLSDGHRTQSEIFSLKPQRIAFHDVNSTFSLSPQDAQEHQGGYSLCVAAQSKIAAYTILRDRETQAITTVDHFQTYQSV